MSKTVRHSIYARHSRVNPDHRLSIPLIKRCVRTTLRLEGMGMSCEVSVLITDDYAIRGINSRFRGIDSPTDVLSFPLQDFSSPGELVYCPQRFKINAGDLQLGDIVISAERVMRQANENEHTIERETAYLTIHSVLHLLGYDHMNEVEKKRMRGREKAILTKVMSFSSKEILE